MPQPRSPEFRAHALDLVRAGEESVATISLKLGISDSCLRKWMRQAGVTTRRVVFSGGATLSDEVDVLRRQVDGLTVEVALLKRVAAMAPLPVQGNGEGAGADATRLVG